MRRKGGEMAVSSFREQWRQALPLVGVPRLLRPWLREPGSLTARCLRHCRDFRVRLLRQESAVPLVEMGVEGRRCLPLREVLQEQMAPISASAPKAATTTNSTTTTTSEASSSTPAKP